ncbi:hypothetical protein L0668_07950 [Paraglaciecola aquimarina]|uniref:PEP-CTERM protein-sorting domain-containing protein n=1 Tax=Paraglaciecola algarum TaxID=3050085 RepID=A0ABS9D5S3_9ALTE|nr:hypothetical protein [Paraglaciecola sp. G1-23]MCF2948034.1 hypothetical protein [Paraglaciecola sp. G1-23]
MKKLLIVMLSFLVSTQTFASLIGNEVIDRTSIDGASNINFVDTSLIFQHDGFITSWDIYAGRANSEFSLQVLRATGTANEFSLVGENYFSAAGNTGLVHFEIPTLEQIAVQTGDVIGWWFGNGQGVIDFTYNSSDRVNWKYEHGTQVNVGDTVLLASGGNREYSISATYTKVPAPSALTLLALSIIGVSLSARKRKA